MPLRAAALLVALALAGCECGGEQPTVAPSPSPAPEPPGREAGSIPRATRSDLPDAVPAVTMTIGPSAVELDDADLIATWPPDDRARVPDALVHVHADVAGPTPGYRIPEIAEGLERMAAVERARAGAEDVTPSVLAVRVDPRVPWRRVVDGLYTAANAGWTEPRIVLRSTDGARDVFLSMPAPRMTGASAADRRASAEVARAEQQIEELLRGLGEERPAEPAPEGRTEEPGSGEPRAEPGAALAPTGGPDAPAPPLDASAEAPIHVVVTDQRRIRISIGARPLAPGCGSVHDAAIDVVDALDGAALGRCLDAARGAGPRIRGARFSSDGAIPFDEIAPLLEAMRARYDVVELAAPM